HACGQLAADRREKSLQKAFHFAGDLGALRRSDIDLVPGDTGTWIGVRAAAHRDESNDTSMSALDLFLGKPRPVAAAFVLRERHAMTGVADVDSPDPALQVLHDQHR